MVPIEKYRTLRHVSRMKSMDPCLLCLCQSISSWGQYSLECYWKCAIFVVFIDHVACMDQHKLSYKLFLKTTDSLI